MSAAHARTASEPQVLNFKLDPISSESDRIGYQLKVFHWSVPRILRPVAGARVLMEDVVEDALWCGFGVEDVVEDVSRAGLAWKM